VVWEAVFLLVILKIPIVYLGCVVYWAIKAEPRPEEGAALQPLALEPDPRPGWTWRRGRGSPLRGGPHGGPSRTYLRRRIPSAARAETEPKR
jgi:hypothetical protein